MRRECGAEGAVVRAQGSEAREAKKHLQVSMKVWQVGRGVVE